MDIDVILVDDNIDRQMSINNKVSRSRYVISLLQVVIVDVSRVITHINTYLVYAFYVLDADMWNLIRLTADSI